MTKEQLLGKLTSRKFLMAAGAIIGALIAAYAGQIAWWQAYSGILVTVLGYMGVEAHVDGKRLSFPVQTGAGTAMVGVGLNDAGQVVGSATVESPLGPVTVTKGNGAAIDVQANLQGTGLDVNVGLNANQQIEGTLGYQAGDLQLQLIKGPDAQVLGAIAYTADGGQKITLNRDDLGKLGLNISLPM